MRKTLVILAVLMGTLAMASSAARADHRRFGGCNSGWGGYSSFGFYSTPTYYSAPMYYAPSYSYGYSSYGYPTTGVYYSRPGLSISIGRGYGIGSFGGYGGYHRHHHHHHH